MLIGLSGGIDSSLTAAIAVDAVGAENVTGVGMPGPFSSDHSVTDARAHGASTWASVSKWSPSLRCTTRSSKRWSPLFAGAPPDVTEENLQSRLRGVTLMALSNKTGRAGADHRQQERTRRRLLHALWRYVRRPGGHQRCSEDAGLPALPRRQPAAYRTPFRRACSTKPPSAELRPDQKDTDSLPEYDVLDRILKAYVEDAAERRSRSPRRSACRLELVRDIINKVDRNEYKRQQAAPGLKVTTKAFGIGRRFPIAQRFTE